MGESVGVNKIIAKDIPLFINMLECCSDNDFFERGIEFAIEKGLEISPIDITEHFCIEIDSKDDLVEVNKILKSI